MERDRMRAILSRAKVGIAGAGGLGSNCAIALARAGVGALVIADFDLVSAANLDRQYYFSSQIGKYKVDALAENLALAAPGIEVAAHRVRIDPETARVLYRGCDAIVEALDDADAKTMFIQACLDAFPETDLVGASGLAGVGRFESIRVIHSGKLHLCGDFENEVSPDAPPCAPRVAIVANLEADIVIDLLLKQAPAS